MYWRKNVKTAKTCLNCESFNIFLLRAPLTENVNAYFPYPTAAPEVWTIHNHNPLPLFYITLLFYVTKILKPYVIQVVVLIWAATTGT